MSYTVITGMSNDYFNLIGKRMLESWLIYWPENFSIIVYTEDDIDFDRPRIIFESLADMEPAYHKFQKAEVKKRERRAKTFAKKAWPIMKHLRNNTGRLIWVDADVITHNYVTKEWLDQLLLTEHFSAHLGVPQSQYYSVETGFFIINLENKFKNIFLDEYQRIYYERDFTGIKKPFDGDVFGKVITSLRNCPGFAFNELNAKYKTRLSPFDYVFRLRMKHYKAARKEKFKEYN